MAKKPNSLAPTPDHETLMKVELRLEYEQVMLLSTEDAAELLKLLSKAFLYERDWGKTKAIIQFQPEREFFTIKPLDMKEFTHAAQAQVLGVPYGEFLEQLNKENNNDNDT